MLKISGDKDQGKVKGKISSRFTFSAFPGPSYTPYFENDPFRGEGEAYPYEPANHTAECLGINCDARNGQNPESGGSARKRGP